jgi:hypothetical protein
VRPKLTGKLTTQVIRLAFRRVGVAVAGTSARRMAREALIGVRVRRVRRQRGGDVIHLRIEDYELGTNFRRSLSLQQRHESTHELEIKRVARSRALISIVIVAYHRAMKASRTGGRAGHKITQRLDVRHATADGLSKEIADERLDPSRQRQLRQKGLRREGLLDAEATHQLE